MGCRDSSGRGVDRDEKGPTARGIQRNFRFNPLAPLAGQGQVDVPLHLTEQRTHIHNKTPRGQVNGIIGSDGRNRQVGRVRGDDAQGEEGHGSRSPGGT